MKRVLNISQWDKLYPPEGAAPDSKTFDITLLFVLLRNICGLTAPATGWDALPPAADVSREANLARIKFYRNHVYGHVTGTGVSSADFEQCWNDISGALIGLRANQVDIDLLKSSAIGETNYIALLTKWKLEEEQLKETVNNLKEMFCELKAKLQNQNTPKQYQCSTTENLPKCDFSLHTSSLVDQFQEGTRLWVLKEIEDFYTNPKQQSRALVITALPGVGKSVLAAVACRNAREKGRLGACHFVQHNDSQRSNPRIVIESIARHLCDTIEGFKEQLHNQLLSLQSDIRKKLDELNLNALFSVLIEEPLTVMQSSSTEQSRVVFIDALDEIEPSSRKEFITVLLSKLKSLPKGIKYILTSRPLEQLTDLPHVTIVNIDARDSYNTDDIRRNGTKLARLLIDGGTETLRRSFDAIHPPTNLQAVLHTNKPQLNTLRMKRVLNISQWDKLYPPEGAAPDSKTFDITLLFVLLRNICGLTAPATGWDALPPAADVSREANLARIKFYRNHVYGHVTGTGVSSADFEQYWNDISGALNALGGDQVEMDLLKSSAIGETNYVALLTKWKLEEDKMKEVVNDLKEMFCEFKTKLQKQNTPKQSSTTENLPKCDFSLYTSSLVDQYQEGTRLWVLKEIEDFYTNVEQASRALVITALPGVGKSVLATVACRNAREKGRLGACHFVQHNDSQRSNPRVVIESIARHLCDTIEGFKEQLHSQLLPLTPDIRKKLDGLNLNALFSVLIKELFTAMQCSSTEKSRVVFTDALDEIEPSSRNKFTTVLLSNLKNLPKGIKFILTSRPLEQLTDLPHVTPC